MAVPGGLLRRSFRLITPTYVLAMAALSTLGFTVGSAPFILLAAFVTLPSSVVSVPTYYIVYGLLAQVPGANPSHSSGSGSCGPNGVCHAATIGEPASWFTFTTHTAGALALIAAAALNVVLLQPMVAARRVRTDSRTQPDTERVPPH